MVQKVSILVHPYFFAYYEHYRNGEKRKAEKDCGRLGRRYREGIRYGQDGLFVFLQAIGDYEPEQKLAKYVQSQIPKDRLCIAESRNIADAFLQERVQRDADVYLFGEDIAACVEDTALWYHRLLGVHEITIVGNYCGKDVPNLESAWGQLGLWRENMRGKIKLTWF